MLPDDFSAYKANFLLVNNFLLDPASETHQFWAKKRRG